MLSSLELLRGHRLLRLDSPRPDVLTWVWARPGEKQVMVTRLRGAPLGVGFLAERPKGDHATGAITKLRHHLHGAVLVDAGLSPEHHLHLTLRRAERELLLELSFAEASGNCRLLTDSGQGVTQLHRSPAPPRSQSIPLQGQDLSALAALGPRLLAGGEQAEADPERKALLRAIDRRVQSLQRRMRAIETDAARADQIPRLRGQANGVMAELHAPQIREQRLHVMDYSVDPPQADWIALAPGETPVQLAERLFQQARRFERGARIAAERARSTRGELDALSRLRQTVLRQVRREDLSPLREEARALGCRGLSASTHGTSKQSQRRLPYREFRSREDLVVLVGRGARDNDQLTLHHASPGDLFLHARGCAGAHVIVPLHRDQACPPETLLDAATLAAHFSKLHGEAQVDVSYAEKRYVRKAKGAPAGQVIVQREKVLPIRMDATRLRRVLATERAQ